MNKDHYISVSELYYNVRLIRYFFCFLLLISGIAAHSQQQDLEFHPNGQFLIGKVILKVKRDFYDPYVWVLAKNNEVYRINSQTMAIDDYTPQFAAYNNLQFIDIAGRSQDTVFIATNSTNVIEYKKGILRTIGQADGLPDTVNSIGINSFASNSEYARLQIATTKGTGEFDIFTEQFFYHPYDYIIPNIRVYEATYRKFTETQDNYDSQFPQLTPLTNYGTIGGMIFEIFPYNSSNNNVTTALTTSPYLISPGYGNAYESSVFWGNNNGLFEESASNSNYGSAPYGHYLNNTQVNKITDIWGLTSFGNPTVNSAPYTLAKENLLVGTDNGLYFSSSIYGNFDINSLHVFSLFHYDILGNTRVNDICVNTDVDLYILTPQGCEAGVWVACDNGLYFIKPDYGKYLDPKTQLKTVICTDLPYADTTTTIKICSGDTAHFTMLSSVATNNIVQWVKDGVDLPGKNGVSFAATEAGDYYAVLYSSCENVHIETNHFKVQVISAPVFSFNYPDKVQYCDSLSTTLKTDKSPVYHYRWYSNGVLNGDTTYKYTVMQSGKFKVEVSACTNSWVPSKEIEVDLIHLPIPQIASVQTSYCAGDIATLTSNITADPSYTINWYLNGSLLPADKDLISITTTIAGDFTMSVTSTLKPDCVQASQAFSISYIAAPVFSFNYPDKLQFCDVASTILATDNNPLYRYRWYSDGVLNGGAASNYTVTQSGKYKVEVSACSNNWVSSKEIEVDLVNLPVPVVSADKSKYCAGENASLTVNTTVDPAYTINWYLDGNIIAAGKDKTNISVTADGNYLATISSTIANCSKVSNVQAIVFTPAPVFTFNYPDKLIYCSGTPVVLKAAGSNAYQYRWYKNGVLTGDVTAALNIIQSGKYKIEVSACDGSWMPSKEVQVDLIAIPVPVIKTDKPSYCIGDNATISIDLSANPAYNINWYRDNVPLGALQNQTSLNTDISGNYTVVITSSEANTDGTICTQTSTAQSIAFNPLPTLNIQQIVRTNLCDGQTVDLKVSYDAGTVKWSNGATSDQVSVNKSGTYTATITSAAGCASDKSIDVQFLPNPILNLPKTGVCVPSHKAATITAPAGMISYIWNGQPGTDTYVVDHPQTVTLTVADANGCQATQDIQVADECPDITIPNAFTPNGDGINDTWDIPGLEYDPTAIVKIFTRNGQQVFESKGYAKPWDGEYKGKRMPSGVYYYVISAKNNTLKYSGPVTVIY